jgi:hypothetical protein
VTLGCAVLAGSVVGDEPAIADGPTTSFSVDLDAGTAGIQTSRTVPVGSLFSISVWLDATDQAAFRMIEIKFHYDDVHLTAPASTIPDTWKDPSVLNVKSGTSAPWPASWPCGPDPAANALVGEDDIGTAYFDTACWWEDTVNTFFLGPVFEYVLRCDIEGPAPITIDDTDWTVLLGADMVPYWGHKHNATVNCGGGSGDIDSDGMPDAYENAHACLNASVHDAGGDPDVDDLTSFGEFGIGADPCDNDTDNDGCADGEEHPSVSMVPAQGGDRDPLVGWDFADVPTPTGTTPGTDGKTYLVGTSVRNKAVALADVGVVLAYVGRTSASAYYTADGNNDTIQDGLQLDRTPSTTFGKPWRSAAPNGAISLQDVGVVLSQVGHNCNPPP